MDRWYSECIAFLNTSETFRKAYAESGFTGKMMMEALRELKRLYISMHYEEDPDFFIRCDHLIEIMNIYQDCEYSKYWHMWTPYFTFMGMSSWNEMWKEI